MVGGCVAVARSLVHGGQYAVHDRDKTLTVLDGHKKGMRIDVERIFLSESKFKLELFKTSCTQNVSPQEFKKMIDFLFSISLPRIDLLRAV